MKRLLESIGFVTAFSKHSSSSEESFLVLRGKEKLCHHFVVLFNEKIG